MKAMIKVGVGMVCGMSLALAAMAQEEAPPPAAGTPPAAPAASKAVNELAPADLPGVTLGGNDTPFFTGIQYGPKPEDVVYFAADMDRAPAGARDVRHQDSRLFVYQPSVHGKTKKPALLKIDSSEGGIIFKPYEVPVAVTNWKGTARFQFMKLNNRYGWSMLVDLSLASTQGARTRMMLFQSDIKGLQGKEDPKAIPLMPLPSQEDKATITIHTDLISKLLTADVRIGEWVVATPATTPLAVSFVGANKMIAGTVQMRAEPKGLTDDKVALWSSPLKRFKPGEYMMKSTLKLGPYGDAVDEQNYSVLAPEKGSSRRP